MRRRVIMRSATAPAASASGPREQHGELLAAHSRDDAFLAHRLAEHRGHLVQHLVADEVAESIVDLLEVIEIDGEERDVAVPATRVGDGALHLNGEAAAIEAARRGVRVDERRELGAQLVERGTDRGDRRRRADRPRRRTCGGNRRRAPRRTARAVRRAGARRGGAGGSSPRRGPDSWRAREAPSPAAPTRRPVVSTMSAACQNSVATTTSAAGRTPN